MGYSLRKIDPPPTTRQAALVMTLSLFIMLLSFFMMLSATSEFEVTKVKAVMQSLDETFSPRIFRDGEGPSVSPDAEAMPGQGQAFESIDGLFKAAFSGIQPQLIPSRGIMFIELPQPEFQEKFFGTDTALTKTLLEKLWTYNGIQIELWINVEEEPGAVGDQAALRARMEQLAAWARTFETGGLEKERLTIGMKKGRGGIVTLLFRNYKPYAPVP